MSDTPRTDKYEASLGMESDFDADFARELERELAAVTEERDRLQRHYDTYRRTVRAGLA